MTVSDDTLVQSISTLSIIGFFLLFTILTVLPLLTESKLRSIIEEKKGVTPTSLLKKMNRMKSFNFRFMSCFGKSNVIRNFLVISLIYLFSSVIGIGNITFQTQYFNSILSFNMILIFVNTVLIFFYIWYLIITAGRISPEDVKEIEDGILWLAENEE